MRGAGPHAHKKTDHASPPARLSTQPYVHLTWRGTQIIKEVFPKHLKEIIRVFSVLSSEELESFGKACKSVGKGV